MNRITRTAVRFLSFVMLAALLAPDARAVDATGGTITYADSLGVLSPVPVAGGYKIHTFTYPGGSFEVLNINGGSTVEYLVVGGGGAGGQRHGGGGGAGGLLTGTGFAVTAQPYAITVGAGGAAYVGSDDNLKAGGPGGNSQFSTIIATGGGGGKTYSGSYNGNGGSGGGGAGANNTTGGTATPSPVQGKNGGSGSTTANGSGGGGASAAGTPGTASGLGHGGDGVQSSISGVVPTPYYAGGGGGGGDSGGYIGGSGGQGGGGHGGDSGSSLNMTAGEDGKGGGGGGIRIDATAADGGDGIVIIRYSFSPPIETTTAVTSSQNPSTYGDSVTFTATVTPASGGPPAGTVTFTVDGVAQIPVTVTAAVLNGTAALASTALTGVTIPLAHNGGVAHTVSATYNPSGNFVTSDGTLSGGQTVNKRPITVTAQPNTKTYDGDTTAEALPQLTDGTTLAPGDTGTFAETYDNSEVGTDKTLTPTAVIKAGLVDVTGNYTVTLENDTTGVITYPMRMFAKAEVAFTPPYDEPVVPSATIGTAEVANGLTPPAVEFTLTTGYLDSDSFTITDGVLTKNDKLTTAVDTDYWVEITATAGAVTDTMLVKITVVSGEVPGTIFMFR